MPHVAHLRFRWFSLIGTSLALTVHLNGQGPEPSAAVLTQHNDNFRLGAYLHEVSLTTANVRPDQFGRLFAMQVDGQIYGQPLYVPNLAMPDGVRHNVVFVATMHNSVYAFDADSARDSRPLWHDQVGTSLPYDFIPMVPHVRRYNIKPEIGIVSTPAIDLTRGTIYVVAKVCDSSPHSKCRGKRSISYWLHALDIVTGAERSNSPHQVKATCPGTAVGSIKGLIVFDPIKHLQRPGVLLANKQVYLAFASHHDTPIYHGWVMAFDAETLELKASYCSTPDGKEGGIWQAGNGPSADSEGNIYVITGNGTYNTEGVRPNLGDSFVKLSPDLQLLDWFSPANAACLNKHDVDLGSTGPVVMAKSNIIVGSGKEGVMYVLDAKNLGHVQIGDSRAIKDGAPCARSGTSDRPPPIQAFQATLHWSKAPTIDPLKVFGYHHMHGSPVVWEDAPGGPMLFVWAERDSLRAFRMDLATRKFPDAAPPGADPTATYKSTVMNAAMGMPGAMLSISEDWREAAQNPPGHRPQTAVVWATMPLRDDAFTQSVEGVLRAFDASDLRELWNSAAKPGDHLGLLAKYTPPTIANGKVYVATFSDSLVVYGPTRIH